MPRPYRLPAEKAAAKAEKEAQAAKERFARKIRGYIFLAGTDYVTVAKAMGVTRQTLHDRLKNPEMMRLGELAALAKTVGVPIVKFFEHENVIEEAINSVV